jgi:hypothetical protein
MNGAAQGMKKGIDIGSQEELTRQQEEVHPDVYEEGYLDGKAVALREVLDALTDSMQLGGRLELPVELKDIETRLQLSYIDGFIQSRR